MLCCCQAGFKLRQVLKDDTKTQLTKAQCSLYVSSLFAAVRTDTSVHETNITEQNTGYVVGII